MPTATQAQVGVVGVVTGEASPQLDLVWRLHRGHVLDLLALASSFHSSHGVSHGVGYLTNSRAYLPFALNLSSTPPLTSL